VVEFYASGGFGSRELRGLLDRLHGIYRGVDRQRLGTFEDFMMRHTLEWLATWVATGAERGYVEGIDEWTPEVLQRLMPRKALFGVVFITMANVYRCITRCLTKGVGCLSDLRTIAETAYSDKLLTNDRELYECGELVRSVVADAQPTIEFLERDR
jgi:hypothetical protein